IMLRLQSDLVDLCQNAIDGKLNNCTSQWDPRAAVGVVLAAGGYPASYRKGDSIIGLEPAAELPGKVFHAGTRLRDGQVTTDGGRVLCATALGESVTEAQRNAYAIADVISWDNVYLRRD